eukprot:gene18055-19864_t
MKNSSFRNPSKSLSIKNELEELVKSSKLEYQDASNSAKERLRSGTKSTAQNVSQRVHMKGKEILRVVGTERQSSSRARALVDRQKALKEKKREEVEEGEVISHHEKTAEHQDLNVIMKGEALIKRDEPVKETDFNDFAMQDSANVDKLLSELFCPPSDQTTKTKPAILAATNTTKSICLEPRKKTPKQTVKARPTPSRRKKVKLSQRQSFGAGSMRSQHSRLSAENGSLPTSPDLVVGQTTFDELDKEFYDIIKSKLKVDLKDQQAVKEDEDGKGGENKALVLEDESKMIISSTDGDGDVIRSEETTMLHKKVSIAGNQDVSESPYKREDLKSSKEVGETVEVSALLEEAAVQLPSSKIAQESQAVEEINMATSHKGVSKFEKEEKPLRKQDLRKIEAAMAVTSLPRTTNKIPDNPRFQAKISEDQDVASNAELIDKEEALKILESKLSVSNEDIVHVAGSKANTESRPVIVPTNNAIFVSNNALHRVTSARKKNSFLTSWTPSSKTKTPAKSVGKATNIHHFCTSVPAIELPGHLKAFSKYQHAPDKHAVLSTKKIIGNVEEETDFMTVGVSNWSEYIEDTEPRILTYSADKKKPSEEETRLTELASKILDDAMRKSVACDENPRMAERSFLKLQNIVDQVFGEQDDDVMCIDGKKAEPRYEETRLYWTPAPPKFDLPPEVVRKQLIPHYHGARLDDDNEFERCDVTKASSEEESSSDEDVRIGSSDKFRTSLKPFNFRLLNRGYDSASIDKKMDRQNLREQAIRETEEIPTFSQPHTSSLVDDANNRASPVQSISEMRKMMAKIRENASKKIEEVEDEDTTSDFSYDAPKRRTISEPDLGVLKSGYEKFDSGYEVSFEELKSQIENIANLKEQIMKKESETEESKSTSKLILPTTQIQDVDDKIDDSVSESVMTQATGAETGLGPPSSIGYQSRRTTRSSLTSKNTLPVKALRKTHSKKATQSKKMQRNPEREQHIKEFLERPARKISRSRSLENIRERQEEWAVLKRVKSLDHNIDFDKTLGGHYVGGQDELFQWTKEEYWYEWFDELYPPSVHTVEEKQPSVVESEITQVVTDEILQKIEVIPSSTGTTSNLYQLLRKEIDEMSGVIETTLSKETLAFHHCRRGACYRKIGELKNAWDDLEKAIELEPKLLDAYWHRHLLYLLQDNAKKALADVDFILKNSTTHIGAYRSRAEIYKKKGDLTAAIFNYSQAIKLDPQNAEIYYQRAYMFRERGDILLALEDFKAANTLLPSRTEGIRNIGIYHFDNRSWSAAVNDFTALITHEPYKSEAYTYRARAHAKMNQYESALKDLSLAIHLDPNSSIGFYYRGCLLRKWEEAMADFEAALRLDSHIPAAHVNLGLIQMTRMNNPHMAIRRFNIAIKVDPTYVRAYICRAEASQKIKNIRAAVIDYTRAIHIRPDITDYRMTRGQLLIEEGKYDLASYHIKQCAQLSLGEAGTQQQAVVQAFLKNFNQAIEILKKTVKSKPLPHLFILLGKTKMKARMFKDAIESFEKALQLMKSWDDSQDLPPQAAEVYFLIGMVYTEMVNHSMALEAFNNTLKVNSEHAEAYYQRGMAKMKLRHSKAIHDFNRALAYNPKLFQAFLSRAAYYGMKGRYAKAIMNCNEVIRLQPRSIRGYLYRGALKYHIKAYQLAVQDLTEAVAIDSNCNIAYFNRAVCYQEMRYFQKALKDYGVVLLLEKKPNMKNLPMVYLVAKVLQNRGLLYLEIKDIYNALQDFAAASKLEPKNPKLHHTLGICYQRLGRLDDAIACFSNALRTNAFFVDALLGRGNALMDYGTPKYNTLARRDYSRALHLDPMCLLARVNLAYSLQVQGRFKAAWMQFTKCIELDEGCTAAYEGRSIINLQMGNSFGAFVDINQALKIEETAEFLTNRGVINQFMNDNVNAIRDYQAALKKDPTYSLAYYNAANLYFIHRQFQQALDYYDRAIGWNRNDESALINRAITRVMLKNVAGAFEDFAEAIALSPHSAHIYFNRGNLYASLGKYEEAEKDYTNALSLQPGDALVYKRRADVRGKISKKLEALQDYKTAIIIQTRRVNAR